MIDLKNIENEIDELKKQLFEKEREYTRSQISNLKEQYGDGLSCSSCAYNCCVSIAEDYETLICRKGKHIGEYCQRYIPDNALSIYIRANHYYDEDITASLSNLFGVLDIMQSPELYARALNILKLSDNK